MFSLKVVFKLRPHPCVPNDGPLCIISPKMSQGQDGKPQGPADRESS